MYGKHITHFIYTSVNNEDFKKKFIKTIPFFGLVCSKNSKMVPKMGVIYLKKSKIVKFLKKKTILVFEKKNQNTVPIPHGTAV